MTKETKRRRCEKEIDRLAGYLKSKFDGDLIVVGGGSVVYLLSDLSGDGVINAVPSSVVNVTIALLDELKLYRKVFGALRIEP